MKFQRKGLSMASSTVPLYQRFWFWLTNDERFHGSIDREESEEIDWFRMIPYIGLHFACLTVFWVGFSWVALSVAIAFYLVRMFFITGFYHRYFSHQTFRASRWFQFLMGFLGCTAGQRGPLWWAAHHRHHHEHSDEVPDYHSPLQRGFWWSHTLWFMEKGKYQTPRRYIPDLAKFKELAWLDRLDWVPFLAYAGFIFILGWMLEVWFPGLGTTRWQIFVWGFLVSTILLYHGTYTINSFSHRFGKRRYETKDDSRNNWFLAILTLGEGWHNNHHFYPAAARQGFFWWEFDPTYYLLQGMQAVGLISRLRSVPDKVLSRT